MISQYRSYQVPESFGQWLDKVIDQLHELGFSEPLTDPQKRWFLTVWDSCDLTEAEAAQAFLTKTSIL